MVLASIAVAKGHSSLRLSGAALVRPPDAAALLIHDADDVWGAVDWVEVDDGVVAKTELVDVSGD